MLEKNIDEEGEPLMKGQDPEKKTSSLQARSAGYIKFYLKKLANDLGRTESELIVLAVQQTIESHYGSTTRKTNVLQKVSNVIQSLFGRRRSIQAKTTKSHGNQ